jgi:hypothetical protein
MWIHEPLFPCPQRAHTEDIVDLEPDPVLMSGVTGKYSQALNGEYECDGTLHNDRPLFRKVNNANATPRCELMDVFCAFQEQGEHITFPAMAREQRKRIMLQLEDYEQKYQVTLHAEDKKSRAAYADLVVTIVEKKEGARAGEGGEGGSDGAGTRAGAQKLPTAPGVARTGAQGARSAPAATGAYVTILKLSISADAKVAALKGLLLVEQDERILQVFCNSWETGKRWSRLAERLVGIGQ